MSLECTAHESDPQHLGSNYWLLNSSRGLRDSKTTNLLVITVTAEHSSKMARYCTMKDMKLLSQACDTNRFVANRRAKGRHGYLSSNVVEQETEVLWRNFNRGAGKFAHHALQKECVKVAPPQFFYILLLRLAQRMQQAQACENPNPALRAKPATRHATRCASFALRRAWVSADLFNMESISVTVSLKVSDT